MVAVTGSNGKTTVKEMTASVLQTWFSTHKASGNLNNHIGVPLAVLGLDVLKRAMVLELGMNHLGEISRLCEIARPNVGVITNIGLAHLGCLGSVEAIQQAKGELTASLDASGVAIVNADDPRALALGQQSAGRLITFGQTQHAHVRGWVQENLGLAGTRCCVALGGVTHEFRLHLPGTHQIMNALAAAAVGVALEVPEERILWGLQHYRGVHGRLAMRRGQADVWLIDDTYNANPQSMQVALNFLAGVSRCRASHRGAGRHAGTRRRRPGVAPRGRLPGLANQRTHPDRSGSRGGTHRPWRLHQAGMEYDRIHHTTSQQEVLNLLVELMQPQDVVLLKGSRGMAMEHLVEALVAEPGAS